MERFKVYVINLEKRVDRRLHVIHEFEQRPEFDFTIVKAINSDHGTIGLWQTIVHILGDLAPKDVDFVIICEDDHQFTKAYTRNRLNMAIKAARNNNADVLLGGVSWFNDSLEVTKNLFWLNKFSGLQFTIIFKKFFSTVLKADFGIWDTADYKISALTTNKFVTYPFISVQKEFGYSDVTLKNNVNGRVTKIFKRSVLKLSQLKQVADFYNNVKVPHGNIINNEDFDNITISTYIVSDDVEQLNSLKEQFFKRREFDVQTNEDYELDKLTQWQNIVKIVNKAKLNNDDVIVLATNFHEFSSFYTKEYLIRNIVEASDQECAILLGGASFIGSAFPLTAERYWIDSFSSSQFIVLFRKVFDDIINYKFKKHEHTDRIFSEITSHKMILYPFISSYIDPKEKSPSINHFDHPEIRLKKLKGAFMKFSEFKVQDGEKIPFL